MPSKVNCQKNKIASYFFTGTIKINLSNENSIC